jgi:hypothetical protein
VHCKLIILINELYVKLIHIVFSLLVSGCFSAIRSGDYYMFDELDDDVLEEKDEMSSDEEDGKHDGERQVTLSKVNTFVMYVLVENRLSVCGKRVV